MVLSFVIYPDGFEAIGGSFTYSGPEPTTWSVDYDDNVGFWTNLTTLLGGSTSFGSAGSFPGGTIVKCRVQARDALDQPLSEWYESNTLNL